jgi:hypothetical protein
MALLRKPARSGPQPFETRMRLTRLFPGQLLPADLVLLLKPYPAPVGVQQHEQPDCYETVPLTSRCSRLLCNDLHDALAGPCPLDEIGGLAGNV